MLVLSRKSGQAIMVGNSIRITVVELSGGTVRLGFEAPDDISIYRDEIYDQIADANRTALSGTDPDGD